jgi:hypothetical protein
LLQSFEPSEVVDQLSIAVPRRFQRLTAKFILEVAFSVLVTLAATKIVSQFVAPGLPKATLRADVPVTPDFSIGDRSSSSVSPSMSRFMEQAALSHVSAPRPEKKVEQIVTPEAPVSAAPAVWAATQRVARAVPLPPASQERPGAQERVAKPAVIVASLPSVRSRVSETILRPPADIGERPAAPAEKKNFITKVGNAIPSPMRIVDGVAHVGGSITSSIGSLFRRF